MSIQWCMNWLLFTEVDVTEKNEELHFPVNLDRLKLLLDELPWNQTQLAEKISISDSELSKWKTGDRHISQSALKRLCDTTCCNPLWLLGISDIRVPDISWKQLDIAQASGKLNNETQMLFLAMLSMIGGGIDHEFIVSTNNLFMELVKNND